jgi:hypothetical protein
MIRVCRACTSSRVYTNNNGGGRVIAVRERLRCSIPPYRVEQATLQGVSSHSERISHYLPAPLLRWAAISILPMAA